MADGWSLAGKSPSALCTAHRRDASGNVITQENPALAAFAGRITQAEKLAISKPEDGAEFYLVEGALNQQIVCQAIGNPSGSRLWWFVDGRLEGESDGAQAKTVPMTVGRHVITCTTAEGVSASVRITVTE